MGFQSMVQMVLHTNDDSTAANEVKNVRKEVREAVNPGNNMSNMINIPNRYVKDWEHVVNNIEGVRVAAARAKTRARAAAARAREEAWKVREMAQAVAMAVAAVAATGERRQVEISVAAEAAIISAAAAEAAKAEVTRTLIEMGHMQLLINVIEKMEIAKEVSKVLLEEAKMLASSVEILLKNV